MNNSCEQNSARAQWNAAHRSCSNHDCLNALAPRASKRKRAQVERDTGRHHIIHEHDVRRHGAAYGERSIERMATLFMRSTGLCSCGFLTL